MQIVELCTLQDPGPLLSSDNRCVCCSWQCWCVSHAFSLHAQSGCQERGLNLRLEMGAVEIPGSGCLAPWNRILGRTEAMKREGEEPLPSLLCRFDAPLLTLPTYSVCLCANVQREKRRGKMHGISVCVCVCVGRGYKHVLLTVTNFYNSLILPEG